MKLPRRVLALIGAGSLAAFALVAVGSPSATATSFGYQNLNNFQKAHVSGLLAQELGSSAAPRSVTPVRPNPTTPQQPGPYGCPASQGDNIKVNQNCLNLTDPDLQGRGQAQNETWIAADPNNPAHLVASYNDYRRGDGTCGVSYSLNGGKTWADTTTPERVHPRRLRRHGPGVLAGRRRHLGRLGHQGQRLPVLPGVQPRRRHLAEPRPVQRVLRVPLHRHRRCVVQLPRPSGGHAQRHRRRRQLPAGQAADDRRQPRRAAGSPTGST